MKCGEAKRLVALDVEGDLPERQSRPLARHLQGCARCRELGEELKESQAFLKSLGQDSVPETVLRGVRHRVLARIDEARESLGWRMRIERALMMGLRQRYAMGSLALILVAALAVPGIVYRYGSDPIDVTTVVPPVPELGLVADVSIETVPEATVPAPAPAVVEARPDSEAPEVPAVDPAAIEETDDKPSQVVKLLTDDPNVIIYWVIDDDREGGV